MSEREIPLIRMQRPNQTTENDMCAVLFVFYLKCDRGEAINKWPDQTRPCNIQPQKTIFCFVHR